MTNRENVGFDEVRLYQINEETGAWVRFADAFLDYPYDSFTDKTYKQNILFENISNCIVKLHDIMSANIEGKANYLLEFYATTDKDYFILSDDKIKNICSSIECELDFTEDLNVDENVNLTNLIREIKNLIKNHRNSEEKLEDKTYDMIGSSMSHWEMANSRRIYLLYKKQEKYMQVFQKIMGMSCSENTIASFVKYRNDVTHGRYRTLDSTIADTAYVLMALVYCCFLQRIGIGEDDLKKIFEENRIAS